MLAEIATGQRRRPRRRARQRRRRDEATAEADAATAPRRRADGRADAAAAAGETIDIVTPTAGESVTEGTLVEWHVAAGDAVDGRPADRRDLDRQDRRRAARARPAGTITEVLVDEGATVTRRPGHRAHDDGDERRVGDDAGAGGPRRTAGGGDGDAPRRPPTAVPSDAKISPVAARIAAAEGIDLANVTRLRPRRTDHEGRRPRDGRQRRRAPPAAPRPSPRPRPAATPQPLRGGAGMLAKYMDESRSIPTATSFRTITVTTMDGRRKQLKDAGQRVSFTHLIAYAIALAAQNDAPVMAHHFAEIDGKPHRVDDDRVNLGIAVDVEKKDGSRTLMVPGHPRRRAARASATSRPPSTALIEKARTNTLSADDLTGANISLTNPGGLGTVASVPRLMVGQGTIVATGSIGYPVGLKNIGDMIGAEKVMTMTSTYDHRIIQGAESGRFLQLLEAYLDGENGFYDGVFASLGVELGPTPAPPAPAAAAAAARAPPPRRPACRTRRCSRPSRPRRRSSRPTAPTATSPRASTRSAPSPRAIPRSTRTRSA